MSRSGIEPKPPRWEATEHSSKELFEQLFNSYSEHLYEPATLLKLFKLFKLCYSSSHHIAIFNDLKLQFYERQISEVSKFGGI